MKFYLFILSIILISCNQSIKDRQENYKIIENYDKVLIDPMEFFDNIDSLVKNRIKYNRYASSFRIEGDTLSDHIIFSPDTLLENSIYDKLNLVDIEKNIISTLKTDKEIEDYVKIISFKKIDKKIYSIGLSYQFTLKNGSVYKIYISFPEVHYIYIKSNLSGSNKSNIVDEINSKLNTIDKFSLYQFLYSSTKEEMEYALKFVERLKN